VLLFNWIEAHGRCQDCNQLPTIRITAGYLPRTLIDQVQKKTLFNHPYRIPIIKIKKESGKRSRTRSACRPGPAACPTTGHRYRAGLARIRGAGTHSTTGTFRHLGIAQGNDQRRLIFNFFYDPAILFLHSFCLRNIIYTTKDIFNTIPAQCTI
jgi:hypothetical protein